MLISAKSSQPNDLCRTLKEEGDKIRGMQTHRLWKRVLQGTTDAERLLSAYKNIERAIGDLGVSLLASPCVFNTDTY
jgi:hypothetical protein